MSWDIDDARQERYEREQRGMKNPEDERPEPVEQERDERGRPKQRHEDGYRYIRQYETNDGPAWALWERVDGKMQRLGTCRTEQGAYSFINSTPPKRPTF